MKRLALLLTMMVGLVLTDSALSADKLKIASAVKLSANYYLPIMAAQEQGLFKQNNLEVEWVPLQGGGPMYRAVAAGAVKMGFTMVAAEFQAAARGISVMIVSTLQANDNFYIWSAPTVG